LPEKLQDSTVADPSLNQSHQQFLVDRVKVTLDVSVYHIPTPHQSFPDHLDRLLRTALWAKPIRVILKVGLKDRFNYNFARLLNYPISHTRYP
jgi:hypothetical protein